MSLDKVYYDPKHAALTSLSKYNDKYKYLLNIIDTFSRYGWSVTPKDKTANSITAVL